VRANFIPNVRAGPEGLADRGHRAYEVLDTSSAENVMTVRANRTDAPQVGSARQVALRERHERPRSTAGSSLG